MPIKNHYYRKLNLEPLNYLFEMTTKTILLKLGQIISRLGLHNKYGHSSLVAELSFQHLQRCNVTKESPRMISHINYGHQSLYKHSSLPIATDGDPQAETSIILTSLKLKELGSAVSRINTNLDNSFSLVIIKSHTWNLIEYYC